MGGPIGKGAATTIVITESTTQMRRRDGRDRLDANDVAGAESVSLKQSYSSLPRCHTCLPTPCTRATVARLRERVADVNLGAHNSDGISNRTILRNGAHPSRLPILPQSPWRASFCRLSVWVQEWKWLGQAPMGQAQNQGILPTKYWPRLVLWIFKNFPQQRK